ncbi:hypothetical protein EVAR_30630_1 [Eumeta japonica]|uniref:Uncharacterized protein n=1 Tax=Eumeta variegata TaxID=151549 RepID=A0A4C1VS58_EUMVA|nr:hypothetical protein EVAR_30630_1 [Eumeta japonica]
MLKLIQICWSVTFLAVTIKTASVLYGSTDAVFGRRYRRMSFTQTISQISATPMEVIINPALLGIGWERMEDLSSTVGKGRPAMSRRDRSPITPIGARGPIIDSRPALPAAAAVAGDLSFYQADDLN